MYVCIVCFAIIFLHPLTDDELDLYASIQVMTYLCLYAHLEYTLCIAYMCHCDLGIKSVGYFITKVWFMQSADNRGVVMMHLMSVCEYGHWLIN